jgi:hypothetical protein
MNHENTVKWKKPDMIHLSGNMHVKSLETKDRVVVARDWGADGDQGVIA